MLFWFDTTSPTWIGWKLLDSVESMSTSQPDSDNGTIASISLFGVPSDDWCAPIKLSGPRKRELQESKICCWDSRAELSKLEQAPRFEVYGWVREKLKLDGIWESKSLRASGACGTKLESWESWNGIENADNGTESMGASNPASISGENTVGGLETSAKAEQNRQER